MPLLAVRVGRRMIVSVPGEGTKEVGERIRQAAGAAVAGSGIEGVVVSGLANEFVLYFTTPEEYDRQHYEGGNTHFGRMSSVLVQRELAKLAGNLARGEPAAGAVRLRLRRTAWPRTARPTRRRGRRRASLAQPAAGYGRLQRATLLLAGRRAQGLDRPVDRAFVTAQRRKGAPLGHPGLRPRAWRCCGRSTATAATRWRGRSPSTPRAAPTAAW